MSVYIHYIPSAIRCRKSSIADADTNIKYSPKSKQHLNPSKLWWCSFLISNIFLLFRDDLYNDDLLEKQIEEKEKILAKMLNLESLSIASPKVTEKAKETQYHFKPYSEEKLDIHTKEQVLPEPKTEKVDKKPPATKPILDPNVITDLVPKMVKLPNTWNLENIELRLDMKTGSKDVINHHHLISPDEHLDSEWEVIWSIFHRLGMFPVSLNF